MKKCIILGIAISFALLPATGAMADNTSLFIAKCGSCHKSGGQAASINPADKAGIVWGKYFKRGRHPVDMGISDSDLNTIIQYLKDHAADSDQPAMAVIPK